MLKLKHVHFVCILMCCFSLSSLCLLHPEPESAKENASAKMENSSMKIAQEKIAQFEVFTKAIHAQNIADQAEKKVLEICTPAEKLQLHSFRKRNQLLLAKIAKLKDSIRFFGEDLLTQTAAVPASAETASKKSKQIDVLLESSGFNGVKECIARWIVEHHKTFMALPCQFTQSEVETRLVRSIKKHLEKNFKEIEIDAFVALCKTSAYKKILQNSAAFKQIIVSNLPHAMIEKLKELKIEVA